MPCLAQFFSTTTDYLLGNSNVRHLPDQVELQVVLQAQLMNALQSFFVKNSDLPIPELEKVLVIGIRQAFQSILKSTGNFLHTVSQLP